MAEIAYRYPTFAPGPNTIRTLDPPRFRDDYSFSGMGRARYQHVNPDRFNVPHPTPPIVPAPEVPTEPGEPRG